jgi:hypothetical protein
MYRARARHSVQHENLSTTRYSLRPECHDHKLAQRKVVRGFSGTLATAISLFALARRMGTSVEMIDQTYGHLAPDADEWELGRLDAFDARENAQGGHILGTGD